MQKIQTADILEGYYPDLYYVLGIKRLWGRMILVHAYCTKT